ncbi:VOC family protein [Xanthobacter sediminis]
MFQVPCSCCWSCSAGASSEGSAINHLAFSYDKAEQVLIRMKSVGVPVVRELKEDPRHGHTSFFVRGPDGHLIEIVEDRPVPEGSWSR